MNSEKLLEELSNGYLYGKLDINQIIADLGQDHFVQFLLDNTGNPHSLIRENVLGLVEADYLSDADCARMLDVYLRDSHLFNGLGSQGDDSVFWRSFSSLCVGYLAEIDGDRDFLSTDQYMAALKKAIEYMEKEVDRRGFVAGKGWAHAVGHGADMLCGFIKSPKFPMALADDILKCTALHIVSGHSYTDGEERRLSAILLALMEKGLDEAAVKAWLERLIPRITVARYTDAHYESTCIIFTIA
ncbi:MAG: DUF2785 domain-containing protein, partial [Defluviitaleaceae bacterium]|nr:DUF2785 domain-containing protein [Defluviitaleaceae bacterium]